MQFSVRILGTFIRTERQASRWETLLKGVDPMAGNRSGTLVSAGRRIASRPAGRIIPLSLA
jgi:hypothetical protein